MPDLTWMYARVTVGHTCAHDILVRYNHTGWYPQDKQITAVNTDKNEQPQICYDLTQQITPSFFSLRNQMRNSQDGAPN